MLFIALYVLRDLIPKENYLIFLRKFINSYAVNNVCVRGRVRERERELCVRVSVCLCVCACIRGHTVEVCVLHSRSNDRGFSA